MRSSDSSRADRDAPAQTPRHETRRVLPARAMLYGLRLAVVVPAYKEERLLGRMLRRLPAEIDTVWVIDDASPDATAQVASSLGDSRVRVLRHRENRGVGAAIVTGYRAAQDDHDVLVVMAGDDQMHPGDLPALVAPIAAGLADYVKGNRFAHPEAYRMPWLRRLGGEVLSFATRLSTGLRVTDCQCGYTALSARAARTLPLEQLWPRFGYPNDLLGMLASRQLRVQQVPVLPVYADEQSGLRPYHVAQILGLIVRRHWIEMRVRREMPARSNPASARLGVGLRSQLRWDLDAGIESAAHVPVLDVTAPRIVDLPE
ncbi:MAG TPA: glycosyltransferase family 2 protein [Polyangiaceae bacterium]|nr:glycosyltransferase family 2 protein [Polyangiaceae bacterium]